MLRQKRERMIKRYALEFCAQVRRDFPRMGFTDNSPKVKAYPFKGSVKRASSLHGIAEQHADGSYIIDGEYISETGEIIIYNIAREKPEILKETIRHEALHFILDKSGLPYKDDSETFLIFALKYSARPYGILSRPDLLEKFGLE